MRRLIVIFHFITDKLCWLLFGFFNFLPSKVKGYILMYHNIIIIGNEDTCTCTLERFKQQLLSMQERNIEFISIDELLVRLKENRKYNTFAIISFDDAYESVYRLAYPVLKALHIPFVIYQVVSLLDKEDYLKTWQIKEMLESGLCTLASHGMTHNMLSKMGHQEIETELRCSKEELEKRFGVRINHFAYPYGKLYSVGFTAPKIAQKYYDTAVVTIPMRLNYLSRKNKYILGRVVPFFNYNL